MKRKAQKKVKVRSGWKGILLIRQKWQIAVVRCDSASLADVV
jgi:hypothetical protein